ncbi:hypothetical protein WMF30_48655 [Sorangium sp. So ce134]
MDNQYTFVSVGDIWTLSFGRVWLIAQEVRSSDDAVISAALPETVAAGGVNIDAEQIPTAVAVLANRRQLVSGLSVGEDASLTLRFANERELYFPTTIDAVDWQWALTRDASTDPYTAFLVACLFPGEIALAEEERASRR